jgi:hypothetical protein
VEDEDESTVNKQDLLTKEEDCKYWPLYERLVNHNKVKSIAHKYTSKASSKKGEKQVMAHITCINLEVRNTLVPNIFTNIITNKSLNFSCLLYPIFTTWLTTY